MDESEAIRRLKQGDIHGLEYLVSRHQVQAVRAAYLVCKDRATAEDIVQEAFVRAYLRIDKFDPTRPFHPWFMRIVVNDALKAAARAGRTISLDSDLSLEIGEIDTGLENWLEAMETSADIREAISQLPPAQRAVIVLRYYIGLTDEEASTQLDCPPGTVRWRLHSGRARLRRLLTPRLSPSSAAEELAEAGSAPGNMLKDRGEGEQL